MQVTMQAGSTEVGQMKLDTRGISKKQVILVELYTQWWAEESLEVHFCKGLQEGNFSL